MNSAASSTARAVTAASRVCVRCRLDAARQLPSLARPAAALLRQTPSSIISTQPRRFLSQTSARSLAEKTSTAASSSETTSSTAATEDDSSSSSSSAAQPSRTFYDLFPTTLPSGPPPAGPFPIDVRALRREFLQHQARTHPDLHPPEAKTRAEAASSLLNEAYRTLANPLLRAQYLLALRGIDLAGDETMKVDEPGLLATVLEAREEIEDAVDEGDLVSQREVNDGRIRDGEEALEHAFKTDDVEAAKRESVRMRYWVNIKDSLDNWEPGKPVVLQH